MQLFAHRSLQPPESALQDYSYRLSVVIGEQTGQLQELRRQLSLLEQELSTLKRGREKELGGEAERLQSLLKEKEAFIKVPESSFTPAQSLKCCLDKMPRKKV